ncbi:NADPH-dependent FMN reductase [Alcaligenaceae bacterium]|nr:NADPH-dependent FMN reductase [Alcaligenaceae bacterium]
MTRITKVLAISASPSPHSKTAKFVEHVIHRMGTSDLAFTHLRLRDIPGDSLLTGQMDQADVANAVKSVEDADAIIIATPIFKAAYSGLLKAFLDILPQFALAGKSVLPLATGGTIAHVLALDYALRPVLQSMGARHIIQGYFLPEADITQDNGQFHIKESANAQLMETLYHFQCVLGTPAADKMLGHPRPERVSAAWCLPSLDARH